MILRGLIVSVNNGTTIDKQTNISVSNTCSVRIPAFDRRENKMIINKVKIMTLPGLTATYKTGDAVYVGFEENSYKDPVILGKMVVSSGASSNETIEFSGLKASTIDSVEITATKANLGATKISGKLTLSGDLDLGKKGKDVVTKLITENTDSIASKFNDSLNKQKENIEKMISNVSDNISTLSKSINKTPEKSPAEKESEHFKSTNLIKNTTNFPSIYISYRMISQNVYYTEKVDKKNFSFFHTTGIGSFKGGTKNLDRIEFEISLDTSQAHSEDILIAIPIFNFIQEQSLDFISIDNTNTWVSTDYYSINPGYYSKIWVEINPSSKYQINNLTFSAWTNKKKVTDISPFYWPTYEKDINYPGVYLRISKEITGKLQVSEKPKNIHVSVNYAIR